MLTRITAPAVEPVTLAEAKLHLRVDSNDEDVHIAGLITAAREQAESNTRRALITQTWRLTLDAFPGIIELPRPRLQAVTSVQYVDTGGVMQTLDASAYQVAGTSEPARILPAYGRNWPATRHQLEAVSITYTAGYGNAGADVPASIRQWMLLYIGALYENREAFRAAERVGGVASLPTPFLDGLLANYRMLEIA